MKEYQKNYVKHIVFDGWMKKETHIQDVQCLPMHEQITHRRLLTLLLCAGHFDPEWSF